MNGWQNDRRSNGAATDNPERDGAGEVMLRRLSEDSIAGLLEKLAEVEVVCSRVRDRLEKFTEGGRVHCSMPLCLVALMPELEPHWQAWFWLGALFGAGAWLLLRMVAWVKADMRQEKLGGGIMTGQEALQASLARQRARMLTESEHRELLLMALSDAMRNPLRRVDIRGIPALWPLTEAQRGVWLAWLRGKELEWGGYRWTATVERIAHLVFVRFALAEGEVVIVARTETWPTVQQREVES